MADREAPQSPPPSAVSEAQMPHNLRQQSPTVRPAAAHVPAAVGCDGTPVHLIELIPGQGGNGGTSENFLRQYIQANGLRVGSTLPIFDPRLVWDARKADFSAGQLPKPNLPIGWDLVGWDTESGVVICADDRKCLLLLTPQGPKHLDDADRERYQVVNPPPQTDLPEEASASAENQDQTEENGPEPREHSQEREPASTRAPTARTLRRRQREGPPRKSGRKPVVVNIVTRAYEVRMCPGGLRTVADGWKWLEEHFTMENHHISARTVPVQPTEPRNVTNKYPIAWLIQHALEGYRSRANPPLLAQDRNAFHWFRSTAVPVGVDIKVLGDIDILLYEKLAYFPNFHAVDEFRAYCRALGVINAAMARFFNYIRQAECHHAIPFNNIAVQERLARARTAQPPNVDLNDLTITSWTLPTTSHSGKAIPLADYPLLGLAVGVSKVPQGPYREGPLTKLINWCVENGRYDAMLSQAKALMEEAGISNRVERDKNDPSKHPDKLMVAKYLDAATEYDKEIQEQLNSERRGEWPTPTPEPESSLETTPGRATTPGLETTPGPEAESAPETVAGE